MTNWPAEEDDLDDLDVTADPDDVPASPETLFPSLDAFVEHFLHNRRVVRSSGNRTAPYWCAHWWRHPEAINRFRALWEAWEVAVEQPPPAISAFWRDHADHHMAYLTGNDSPFRLCTAEEHKEIPVWPTVPAPAGLFSALIPAPQPEETNDL